MDGGDLASLVGTGRQRRSKGKKFFLGFRIMCSGLLYSICGAENVGCIVLVYTLQ